jgi:glycosyltransferase involved in cell wall biosynthesis
VSVVTPVYNGERYLAECIESVLSQTHSNWEYVIANNCSTDRTAEIAERYASADPRVRVGHTERLLEIIPNWNNALRQISPESRYCKVVHADDCLFAECLEHMVELAEAHPNVGIVGSYRVEGSYPMPWPALPHTRNVFPGIEICRGTLREEHSLFGSPSCLLMRSDLVRERERFYDESYLHADKAVCLELLQHWDFGFVHQVLTHTRLHEESQSVSLMEGLGTRRVENLLMLRQFGPSCLPEDEYVQRFRAAERRYYRFLARKLLGLKGKDLLRFHSEHLRKHTGALSARKLGAAAATEVFDLLLDPRSLVRRLSPSARGAGRRER